MKLQQAVKGYLKELQLEERKVYNMVMFEIDKLVEEMEAELITWDVDNMDNFVGEVRAFYKI